LRLLADENVEFLGWCTDEDIRDLYGEATAVLLPGTEDFGMVPVKQKPAAPRCGVWRRRRLRTVVDGQTGVLVADSSADAFAEGLARAAGCDSTAPRFVLTPNSSPASAS
jgi:glycosyltransferase involved in cell wall biosynthesis